MLRVPTDTNSAATCPDNNGQVGSAARLSRLMSATQGADNPRKRVGRIDNFAALAEAHGVYCAMVTPSNPEQSARADTPEAGASAWITQRMPEPFKVGCWRCERAEPKPYAGAVWIRHDHGRHYLVFTNGYGNQTEYPIYYCPWCGNKL